LAAASPDGERMEEMVAAVDAGLAEVGADELPVVIVLNKVDLVDPLKRRRLAHRLPGGRRREGARRGSRPSDCSFRTTRVTGSPNCTSSGRRSTSGSIVQRVSSFVR